MFEQFKLYVSKYDMSNEKISYKYNHSLRVSEIARKLATEMKLSKDDIQIALESGLLHDIGRFEQIKQTGGYDDAIIDHAKLSIQALFDEGEINKYGIETSHHQVLKNAIMYHSVYEVPNELDEKSKLFAGILRDADKIDIMDAVAKGICVIPKTKFGVTSNAKNQFLNYKLINYANILNDADSLLLLFSYIFDINNEVSFNYILEHQILDSLYRYGGFKFRKYYKITKKYIKRRMK